ncbi:MAG TPA: hypothetical protein ACFYEK_01130 [Candidatus Wunengus sp. YC60]|uniref:hypothetical protein n=1 Tax=Candidatus Wunengus sp. YC60 TaxID=3367697 RepID=UPI004025DA18
MKAKYKLDGPAKLKIEALAKVLPAMNVVKNGKVVYTTVYLTGKGGLKLKGKAPKQVNHKQLLTEAYKNNGLQGLAEYACYVADMINPPKVKEIDPLLQLVHDNETNKNNIN